MTMWSKAIVWPFEDHRGAIHYLDCTDWKISNNQIVAYSLGRVGHYLDFITPEAGDIDHSQGTLAISSDGNSNTTGLLQVTWENGDVWKRLKPFEPHAEALLYILPVRDRTYGYLGAMVSCHDIQRKF